MGEKKLWNCPKCQQTMVAGSVQVRGTAIGFLMVGFSHQHLYFDDPTDNSGTGVAWQKGKPTLVLPSREEVRGYRCMDCRITLIER